VSATIDPYNGSRTMPATLNSTRRRSNKPITQFACDLFGHFIDQQLTGSATRSRYDTSVSYSATKVSQLFFVNHCNRDLLNVAMQDWRPCSIRISFSGHFNLEGMVDDSAIERLNGLLDTLGSYGAIPDGVRVFRSKEGHFCYFGKGDERIAIGPDYASYVLIECNPVFLTIIKHDL